MTSDQKQLLSYKHFGRYKMLVSLRTLAFLLGVFEIFGLALSLFFRSQYFNSLQHHIQSKDATIRYAFESAQILAAIRIGYEILLIIAGASLCFGTIRKRYHLVAVNFQAFTIYAVLSPIMWWEILYFYNLHLIWILPVWLGKHHESLVPK